MSCLDNIISINGYCGENATASLSGLDLFDAPEISPENLAKITNEQYINGKALAHAKVALATKLVSNDMMSIMAANSVLPNLMDTHYTTGEFKIDKSYSADGKEKGVTLYRNARIKGNLRKIIIHKIFIYPITTANNVVLKIYDDWAGGMISTYTIDLIANQVNEFEPEYIIKGTFARVILDGSEVSVASSYLTCFTGCNGSMPNDCGYTKGWIGNTEISEKEGYGIVLDFSCKCDYDDLLCGMANNFLGELVWLKSRVLLVEERLHSNRWNNWIIYNREVTADFATELENDYRSKWNTFAQSLPKILKQYRDDCLECRGTRWVDNI